MRSGLDQPIQLILGYVSFSLQEFAIVLMLHVSNPVILLNKELLASLDASVMQNLGLGADHLDALRSRMHLAYIMFATSLL